MRFRDWLRGRMKGGSLDKRGGGVHSVPWHYAQNSYSVPSRKSRGTVTADFSPGKVGEDVGLTSRPSLPGIGGARGQNCESSGFAQRL